DGNLVIYTNVIGALATWKTEKVFDKTTTPCAGPRGKKTVVSVDTWFSAPASFITLPTADPWRCGYACAGKADCVAWQFTPPGWNDPTQAGCWLATSRGSGLSAASAG